MSTVHHAGDVKRFVSVPAHGTAGRVL